MAQWFISASDANVLDNFTQRNDGGTLSVVNDGSQNAIRMSLPSNGRVFYSFDPAEVGQDFEIVTRLRSGSAAASRSGAAVGARVSGGSAALNGIRFADFSLSNGQVGSYVGGSFTQRSNNASLVNSVTEYHWMRARIVGGLIQFKMWDGAPDDEPAIWATELEFTDNIPDGRPGLLVAENGNHFYTHIGFATNGDTAPTEPVGSGATIDVETESYESQYFDGEAATGALVSADTYSFEFNYYDASTESGASISAETYLSEFEYYDGDIAQGATVSAETLHAEFAYFDGIPGAGSSVDAETHYAEFAYYDGSVIQGATIQAETHLFQSQYYDGTVTVGSAFVKTVKLSGIYRKNAILSGNYRKRIDL